MHPTSCARSAGSASCSGRADAWRVGSVAVRGRASLLFSPRRAPLTPDLNTPHHRLHHPRHPAATWKDYLPRIVDDLASRRVPAPSGTEAGASLPLTLPSAAGAADAARRLFFPESLADPASLTIPVLIFGALAAGVAVEVAAIALRTLPGSSNGGGGAGAAPGGGGAGPADSLSSLDEAWEEDDDGGWGVQPPPPSNAPASDAARDRVMGERYRGLAWLAGAAGLALFSAGLLTGSDRPLQP